MFTNRGINFFSLIISIFIFLLIYFNFLNPIKLNQNLDKNNQKSKINIISKIIQKNNKKIDKDLINSANSIEENLENDFWYIKIPSISLKAPIRSGVDLNTLQSYVGHFEDTGSKEGNIGLAAHNRRL